MAESLNIVGAPFTISSGTIVTSLPFLSRTVTWNAAGVTFIDDFRNITATASAAGSSFVQWQIGGTTAFRVRKDGSISDTDTFLQTGINLTSGRYVASATAGGSIRFLAVANGTGALIFSSGGNKTDTTGTKQMFSFTGNSIACGAGDGVFYGIDLAYTINNSGAQTGTMTGIFLNATETALNSMTHNLIDLQVGAASKFKVDSTGRINAGVVAFGPAAPASITIVNGIVTAIS